VPTAPRLNGDALSASSGLGTVGIAGLRPRRVVTPESRMPSIAILGLGYVGLPTALAARARGAPTIGIDISQSRLNAIADLDVDLIQADLELLTAAVADESFVLTEDLHRLADADAVVICVPTPVDQHRNPDLTALHAACRAVVHHARAGQVLILTSTSYPGSARALLAEPLVERGFRLGEDIYVASSPERIDPGNESFPQGTVARVVGGITSECTQRAAAVLASVTDKVHAVSSPEAAEMTKLLENSFRAVNIAFANEMADVCNAMGLNVAEVIDAAATKPYGFMPFYPGTGVGGHCIPCDPHYLLWQLRSARGSAPMLSLAMAAIAARPHEIVEQINDALSATGHGLQGARLLVVGAAYKPGVRDVRESPGIQILLELLARDARVDYYDPIIPSVTIDERQIMLSVSRPDPAVYDAVVVNTLHPGVDYEWLSRAALVIDPGGRHDHERRAAMPVPALEQLGIRIENGPGPQRRVVQEKGSFKVRS
jgi:UDP-N-acetyl-D-glucosamine dehydrogenase